MQEETKGSTEPPTKENSGTNPAKTGDTPGGETAYDLGILGRIQDPPPPCYSQNLKGNSVSRIKTADYNFSRWFFHQLLNEKASTEELREFLRLEELTNMWDTKEIETSRGERFLFGKNRVHRRLLPTGESPKDWKTQNLRPESTRILLLADFYSRLNQKRGDQKPIPGSTLSFIAQLCPLASSENRAYAEQVLGFQHAIHILALGEIPQLKRSKKAELEAFAAGWKANEVWIPENKTITATNAEEWFGILSPGWSFPITADPNQNPQAGPELAAWIACHPEWPKQILP